MKLLLILGLAMLSTPIVGAVPAEATVPVGFDKVFDFSGQCDLDCTGEATAELTLAPSYELGDPLGSSNFISFHYDGTNALPAFTFLVSDVVTYGGSISAVRKKRRYIGECARVWIHSFNNPAGNWGVGFSRTGVSMAHLRLFQSRRPGR